MKHPIYTEKSNISFEKYEPNNNSSCSINCCHRSIDDGIYSTRTTRIGMGGFGGFGGCGGLAAVEEDSLRCGFGCGGGFFVHKTIIQTIHQTNNCTQKETHVTPPPPPPCEKNVHGDDQNPTYNQDQNQKDKQVVCLNTAVNMLDAVSMQTPIGVFKLTGITSRSVWTE